MRIVQTSKAYYPLIGGVETIVGNLAKGFARHQGLDVEVLVCNHVRSFREERRVVDGVNVTYVPMMTKIASLPISLSYPLHLAGMKGDILHVHEPFPLFDLSVRMFPGIFERFSHLVVSWHGDIVRQKWALSMYSSAIHGVLRQADRIIVGTPHLIESSPFLREYAGKCEVIPFGIELDWANKGKDRQEGVRLIEAQYGKPLLLFVGRLVYYKGLKYLVEAMRSLPDARLLIVGSGPLLPDLRKQIGKLGLEKRVSILPHVSDEELHIFYDACDVFVLPSTEVSEAFGLVQVEAMACGKPVVTTNIASGVTYVNQHGVTGLTVPPRDPAALAGALRTLIDDRELRLELGRRAKERALREFTLELMIERMIQLYSRL